MTIWTTGQIAERFNVRSHRVRYVIQVSGIEPSVRVGRGFGFSEAAVKRIGKALADVPTRETIPVS